jgi:ubiquinone/menaquinone biosynthesis C-methylase UbiE
MDKILERERYDQRSLKDLSTDQKYTDLGANFISLPLRHPYIFYEKMINLHIKEGFKVLEIGAGFGMHTSSVLKTGAYVFATDISMNSLKLLKKNIDKTHLDRLTCLLADMEKIPFDDNYFDAVVCAGSLSYGDPFSVDSEIFRVLKKEGLFICVDSYGENYLYKLNRFFHYLRGGRSFSTLKRIPNKKRIANIKEKYVKVQISFFGSIVWFSPILSIFFGYEKVSSIIEWVDNKINVSNSAFKFVLFAKSKKTT